MAYTPRASSIPGRVVVFFENNPDEELTTADIAEKFGCDAGVVRQVLVKAIAAGLLATRHEGRIAIYTKGNGTKPPDTATLQAALNIGQPQAPEPKLGPPPDAFTCEAEVRGEPQPLSPDEYVRRIGREAPTEPLPFNACRYVDGSMIVVGVEAREDGAIIFTPKQAAEIWRLGGAA